MAARLGHLQFLASVFFFFAPPKVVRMSDARDNTKQLKLIICVYISTYQYHELNNMVKWLNEKCYFGWGTNFHFYFSSSVAKCWGLKIFQKKESNLWVNNIIKVTGYNNNIATSHQQQLYQEPWQPTDTTSTTINASSSAVSCHLLLNLKKITKIKTQKNK